MRTVAMRLISAALVWSLLLSGCASTPSGADDSESRRLLYVGGEIFEIPPDLEIRVRPRSDPSRLVTVDDQVIVVDPATEFELVRQDGTRVPLSDIQSIEITEKTGEGSEHKAGDILAAVLLVPLYIALGLLAMLGSGSLQFE